MGTKSIESVAMEECLQDRISSLPTNIIDHILVRLPIREAARTGILSRRWRHVWNELPELVLDKQFSEEIKKKSSSTKFQHYFVDSVNEILLQHHGSIMKFVLHVPKLSAAKYSIMNKWMLNLSRHDLQELTLEFDDSSPTPCRIPSLLFSCPKLVKLIISNSIFKGPSMAMEGFRMLTTLSLEYITFESSLQISIYRLANLTMLGCRGSHHLNISAPNLLKLVLSCNDAIELRYYMKCSSLRYAYFMLSKEVEYVNYQRISLTKLLSYWAKLCWFYLNGPFIKYLAAGSTFPDRLPMVMNNLTYLVPCEIAYDLVHISCILCLLRSCINLRKLEIWSNEIINSRDDKKIVDYLEEAGTMPQSMDRLQTVKMIYFKGSTPELLLVKLLLANSPSIERFYVQENHNLNPTIRLQISQALMRFPRASPKAEMICEPWGRPYLYLLAEY